MEFIFEFIGELVFEGILEVISNKKISKWVRYPLLIFFLFFFISIILGLIYIGVSSLETSLLGGIFLIAVGIILLIACIYKFRKVYLHEKKDSTDGLEK